MTEKRSQAGDGQQGGEAGSGDLTLVDLALFLWAQKVVLVVVVGLSVAIALAYALTRERVYEFTTTIELAGYQSGDTIQTLESADAVIAKLNNSFIPSAIENWASELEAETGSAPAIKLTARRPTDTSLVLLSSPGAAGNAGEIKRLHTEVLAMLVEDQRREYELERTRLAAELELASIELEELEDERVQRVAQKALQTEISQAREQLAELADAELLLEEQLELQEVRRALIESRIPELEAYIEEARARRPDATEGAASGAEGMTLMLINSTLQQDMLRLAQLEEVLSVNIPNERARLAKELAQKQREQNVQAERVERLEADLEKLLIDQERAVAKQRPRVQELRSYLGSLQESRALVEPRQSIRPIDTSSRNLLVLAVIVGLFLGLLLSGVIGLAGSARAQFEREKRGR